eukprot:Gb_01133 [translate_table: standard]
MQAASNLHKILDAVRFWLRLGSTVRFLRNYSDSAFKSSLATRCRPYFLPPVDGTQAKGLGLQLHDFWLHVDGLCALYCFSTILRDSSIHHVPFYDRMSAMFDGFWSLVGFTKLYISRVMVFLLGDSNTGESLGFGTLPTQT